MIEVYDTTIAIALHEYETVRELRRRNSDGAATRFNYFLVIASGGTAVVAGSLGAPGGFEPARQASAAAIAGVVLLLGLVIFVRLVHYRVSAIEYGYATEALRTYLLRQAPDVRPFVLLPTFDDHDEPKPYRAYRAGGRNLRSWAGLAQTVGLVNSVLLGLAAGAATWFAGAWWASVLLGVSIGCTAVGMHRWYERRTVDRCLERVEASVRRRLRIDSSARFDVDPEDMTA